MMNIYVLNAEKKIKLNIKDDIILSINNIKDVINGIKLSIDNIIRISKDNSVNIQLKNVNYLILNTLTVDIKNINDKINNILSNNIIKNDNINNNNYIIAKIEIKEQDVNKNIRILNSYEESMRTWDNEDIKNEYKNEGQIKKCQIQINGQMIPFNYFYKFKSKGKYTIKYSFINNITNIAYAFCECSKLIDINLSNFNTNNVTNMGYMFSGCSSLTNINLSNFNTNNVTDMSCMFYKCEKLNKNGIITKDIMILKELNN